MKTIHIPKTGSFLLILLIFVCMYAPTAHGELLTLVVRSSSTEVGGKVYTVLEARHTAGLGALEVEIVYDPEFLEARSVIKEKMLADSMLECDLRPGRVRCVMISGEPIKVDGAVLSVHFDSKQNSGRTKVGLENIMAWGFERGLEMRVSAASGEVNLQPPSKSWEPVPEKAPGPAANETRSWLIYYVLGGIVILGVLLVWVYRQGRKHGKSN